MVSFRRISSILCICAMLCCFIGMAMPASAASTDMELFSNVQLDFVGSEEADGFTAYYYQNISNSFSADTIEQFILSVDGNNPFFFALNSVYIECSLAAFNEEVLLLSTPTDVLPFYVFQISRETVGGPYDFMTFVTSVDFGSSVTLSVSNYMNNSDPAVSGFLGDLGDVASSGLGLVGSVVSTIVNNPFLLLTVGFFFTGAAVAVLGRILGKS